MDPQIVETVLNLVYFLVGLAVGLFGLWQNQKYFQAQQQDKFDQIHAELRDVRERFATMAEITSERAFARENRLFSLAMQQAAVESAAEQAGADIRAVVLEELQRAGVRDAVQRTADLEEKVGQILVEARQDSHMYGVLLRLPEFELHVIKDLGEEPFTVSELHTKLPFYSSHDLGKAFSTWRYGGIVKRADQGTYSVSRRARRLLAKMNV